MMNGYVSIDCTGLNLLAEEAQTITGLYDRVREAIDSGKPIYAVNVEWGDVSTISPIEVFTVDFGTYIILTASTLQVIVTNEDVVTINNLAPADNT